MFLKSSCWLSGSADDEERRVVVRGDAVGGADAVHAAAVRGTDERAGDRELEPLVPERRLPTVPAEAPDLPPGDLRPHGRVLEAQRRRSAPLRRDPPLPAAQEPRLHAGPHNMLTSALGAS